MDIYVYIQRLSLIVDSYLRGVYPVFCLDQDLGLRRKTVEYSSALFPPTQVRHERGLAGK
jgi:hypothetical protein